MLAETTEIFGAEHLLVRRARNRAVAEKLLGFVDGYKKYLARFEGSFDDNPSPGNKEGGLTNILEKSLGAVAKAGTTPLNDAIDYAERITAPGFVFMNTPGHDPHIAHRAGRDPAARDARVEGIELRGALPGIRLDEVRLVDAVERDLHRSLHGLFSVQVACRARSPTGPPIREEEPEGAYQHEQLPADRDGPLRRAQVEDGLREAHREPVSVALEGGRP